jgi:hypothetical protein
METIIMDNDKRHHPIMATNWETYLMEAIKTGIESPTPYKVIPYKNGIGIKKIEFIKTEKTNTDIEDLICFHKID